MSKAPARAAPPPPEGEDQGASANERLLGAAKSDNEDMLMEAMGDLEDVNYQDGLGNTALHYAVQHGSSSVIEPILEHETCDVDLRNRLNGDTPLHIAVRQRWEDHEGLRAYLVGNLLEAGADTTIRNRHNQKPIDLLPPNPEPKSDDERIRNALRQAEAENMVAQKGDVVDDDEDVFDPNDVASDSD